MRETGSPPGTPSEYLGLLTEVARREWADPANVDFADVESFLTEHGVGQPYADGPRPGGGERVVGAGLLLGGDLRTDRRAGRPAASPVARVPAAVAVIYVAGVPQQSPPASFEIGTWENSWTGLEHAHAVSTVRAAIAAGDVYQVNIVGHRSAPFSGDPAAVGRALLRLQGTPYAGDISGAGWSVFAASPECLLDISDGQAASRPIKGTAAVAAGAAADERARCGLLASGKDRAEHIMIVDLIRNDLGRIAQIGGVSVPELYAVRRLAGVWHAESTVRARLQPGLGLAAVLQAIFPGGSVTGAPKLAALDIISGLEPVGRGPSMGALGWVGADGRISLGLTIRTVAISDGRIHLWTGGGITWGSDPEAEVAEADLKAAPLLRALDARPVNR